MGIRQMELYEQAFGPIKGVTAEGSFWWEPDLAGDFILDEYVRDGGQFPGLWVYACAGWSDTFAHRTFITASDDGMAEAQFSEQQEAEDDRYPDAGLRIDALEEQALAVLTVNFREMAAAIMTVGVVDNWELDNFPPTDTKYHEATAWYWQIESPSVRAVAWDQLAALESLTADEYRDLVVAEAGNAAHVPSMLTIDQLRAEADRIDPTRIE